MSKRVYISADYGFEDGDRNVIDELNKWGQDDKHKIDFVDMAKIVSGSVCKNNPDCRICDLKEEFNRQIKASSIVLFVVGDQTGTRKAGSSCGFPSFFVFASCTPYKQNTNGTKPCKRNFAPQPADGSVNPVNQFSYLRHEFEQAKAMGKEIVIVYNSMQRQTNWLPSYMAGYERNAVPFWKRDVYGCRIGDYMTIKRLLGYA